jgi:hypothetical protein
VYDQKNSGPIYYTFSNNAAISYFIVLMPRIIYIHLVTDGENVLIVTVSSDITCMLLPEVSQTFYRLVIVINSVRCAYCTF